YNQKLKLHLVKLHVQVKITILHHLYLMQHLQLQRGRQFNKHWGSPSHQPSCGPVMVVLLFMSSQERDTSQWYSQLYFQ
uniref:Uncharacterized protein n=1 Tax=Amphimedon queenslandica TaxID=400682 RepID=A0A1X7V4D8_AMPQE